jgi:hypothetical protein
MQKRDTPVAWPVVTEHGASMTPPGSWLHGAPASRTDTRVLQLVSTTEPLKRTEYVPPAALKWNRPIDVVFVARNFSE